MFLTLGLKCKIEELMLKGAGRYLQSNCADITEIHFGKRGRQDISVNGEQQMNRLQMALA